MDDTDVHTHPSRTESPIRRILVESALIVISILLALAANQWADARKQRALTARAFNALRAEISGNAERVRAGLPYHRSLEASSHRADSLGLVHTYADFKRNVPNWSGFEQPEYDGTAWQSAVTLGAVANMGFDTVQVLSRLYTLQSKFDQFNTAGVTTFDFSDAAMPSTVRRVWVYVFTMRVNEEDVLERYTAALKMLGPATKL